MLDSGAAAARRFETTDWRAAPPTLSEVLLFVITSEWRSVQ